MISIAFLALSLAADAPPLPAPDAIAKAVRDLGAPSYHDRERASRFLWTIGQPAEDALREALKSADAEVVARARDLLNKIPYGITPESPRRFVELVASARAGGESGFKAAVPDLLDLGPRGLEVAEKLADRIGTSAQQRAALRSVVDGEAWRITPGLIARGEYDRVESLLERGALANANIPDAKAVLHYAAWLAVRGKAAQALPAWRERAAADSNAATVVAFHVARFAGDRALARTLAEKSGRDELKEAAYFDAGDWAKLAILPPPAGSYRPATLHGLKLIYLQLANEPAAKSMLAELKQLPSDGGIGYIPPLVFRALMYARQPDEAFAIIAPGTLPELQLLKFEMLCQKQQYSEALALPDRPIPDHSPQRWHWDAARLRVLHQLGETAQYQQILSAVPTALTNSLEVAAAQDFIEQLVALGRTADALPFAAAVLGHGVAPSAVFEKLYPKTPLAAEAWWRNIRIHHPDESLSESIKRLPALLDKRLASPEGKAALATAAQFARNRPDAERWLHGFGEACQAVGLFDEARALTEEAAKRFDTPTSWLKHADVLVEQRKFAEAAIAYDAAWRKDERQPMPLWLAGWARVQAGDAKGRDLCERAHLLSLGDEDTRAAFAEEIVKRSSFGPEIGDAARRERKITLFLGGPGSNKGRNVLSALSIDPLARSDRLEAAEDTQRFLIRMLRSNAYFKKHESYLAVLHRLEANRARGLLAKGDVDGALKAAAAAHELAPGYLSPAEHIVLELAKRGRGDDADRIYKSTRDVLDKLCASYPQSAAFHNSRAWLAARCRRDLPQALEDAKKATALLPTTASYFESLAEVHLQRGEKGDALSAIDKALALDPRSRYFALQKTRMQAGDKDAPLPEGR